MALGESCQSGYVTACNVISGLDYVSCLQVVGKQISSGIKTMYYQARESSTERRNKDQLHASNVLGLTIY